LHLAVLNAGDGLYRSLALMDDSGLPAVQVNLIGDSASAGDEVVAGHMADRSGKSTASGVDARVGR
jgi:hypothetical protein